MSVCCTETEIRVARGRKPPAVGITLKQQCHLRGKNSLPQTGHVSANHTFTLKTSVGVRTWVIACEIWSRGEGRKTIVYAYRFLGGRKLRYLMSLYCGVLLLNCQWLKK
ncbi:hypothetical protein FKM82_025972 [Ascaphus truei]